MTLKHSIQSDLFTSGWAQIDGITNDESLIEVAELIGAVLPDQAGRAVAKLSPKLKGRSTSRSFSFHYGHGEFPLHTDTAFWPLPARYVLLRSECVSATATLLLPPESAAETFGMFPTRRALFAVRTTKATTYSAVFLPSPHSGIRFDPCYMTPVNPAASELVKAVRHASSNAQEFYWTGNNALIFDNWRCLHGRRSIDEAESERCLSRIYVGEPTNDVG